jgi:hypothetical protein
MSTIFEKIIAGLGLIVFSFLFILIVGLLFSFPVMWLWNGCLVGLVAGISQIPSVWHAWGILILCGLLFKSTK